MTDEVDIDKFTCIKITQLDKKRFKAPQTFLINHIISFLGFDSDEFDMETNPKASPVAKDLLQKNIKGKPRK